MQEMSCWCVVPYGNHYAVQRYIGTHRNRVEWLGGWSRERQRPRVLFRTLEEAAAARDRREGKSLRRERKAAKRERRMLT